MKRKLDKSSYGYFFCNNEKVQIVVEIANKKGSKNRWRLSYVDLVTVQNIKDPEFFSTKEEAMLNIDWKLQPVNSWDNFSLMHVALYAKNHYVRSENVVEDLQKCLTADGYSGEFFSKGELAYMLVNHVQRLPRYNGRNDAMSEFLKALLPTEVWKVGYYTKDHTWVKNHENAPEYDLHLAIIWTCLSQLACTEGRAFALPFPTPDAKVLPRTRDEKGYTGIFANINL